MISRRLFLRSSGLALGATAVAGTLAACGQGDTAAEIEDDDGPKDMRFAWWGHEEMNRTTNEAIELYNSTHENVTITPENASWDDFWDRMATQIAGDNGADVFQMSNQMLVDYAERGALLDFEQFLGDPIDIADWDGDMQDYGVIDGVRAGIPISTDAFTTLADRDVIERLGLRLPEGAWTWDDLAELANSVHEASDEQLFGMSDASGKYESLEAWVRGRGLTWFDTESSPTTLGFGKEDLIEFWQWWANMRASGGCVPPNIAAEDLDHETSPLITGTAPLYVTTSSELTGVRALTSAPIQALPMPDTDGGAKRANFIRPNLFISAWTGTAYPMECARFIEFWINDPEAVEVIGNSRGVPPSPDSAALVDEPAGDDGLLTPSDFLALITEIGEPMDSLTPRAGRDVYSLLQRSAEEIRFDRTDIPTAVDTFFDQANSLLA